MKLVRFAFRSVNTSISNPFHRSNITRTLSTNPFSGNGNESNRNNDSFESADEFERRIFSGSSGNSLNSYAFFQKLDRLEKARNRPGGLGNGYGNGRGSDSSVLDGLGGSFDTLSDGMDGKLQKAAMYFEYDEDEVEQDGYAFRPDVSFRTGMTYEVKDLDLTKPGVRKPARRHEFEVTTEEVLRKADFRNVRFLANFITEAGIIIKRSKTGISAKAQRKVAREIKTARAFGLMPFTTMGTKSFIFGNTMQNCDKDYEYQTYDRGMPADFDGKGPSEV